MRSSSGWTPGRFPRSRGGIRGRGGPRGSGAAACAPTGSAPPPWPRGSRSPRWPRRRTVRWSSPVLLAALIVTLTTAALTLVLNPLANREFQRQLFKILQARAVSGLQERVFNTSFADLTIFVEDISASQVALRGVIVSDERDPKLTRIITASDGRLLTDEASRRITLRLLNGGINEADVAPVDLPKEIVTEGAPTGGAADSRRYRYTAFSVYDMTLALESPLKASARLDKPEKDLGFRQLRQKIEELGDDAYNRRPYEGELQKRFAFPVAALVFPR